MYADVVMNFRGDDDLTARARIRDVAFVLIAERGVQGATLRAIASEAGVSKALVNHHFGSKQGVVDAVAEWVLERLESVTEHDSVSSHDPADDHVHRSTAYQELLTGVPALRVYLRRMLFDDTQRGREWFTLMVENTAKELRRREQAGMARASKDVRAEAAILNIWALGPILMPGHLEHLFQETDDREILRRWTAAMSELLRSALYPPRSAPAKRAVGTRQAAGHGA